MGNPKEGFVGDITRKDKGYAVHVQPLQINGTLSTKSHSKLNRKNF